MPWYYTVLEAHDPSCDLLMVPMPLVELSATFEIERERGGHAEGKQHRLGG